MRSGRCSALRPWRPGGRGPAAGAFGAVGAPAGCFGQRRRNTARPACMVRPGTGHRGGARGPGRAGHGPGAGDLAASGGPVLPPEPAPRPDATRGPRQHWHSARSGRHATTFRFRAPGNRDYLSGAEADLTCELQQCAEGQSGDMMTSRVSASAHRRPHPPTPDHLRRDPPVNPPHRAHRPERRARADPERPGQPLP
jgi:hypothetical protein